jgi:hypothetical protein
MIRYVLSTDREAEEISRFIASLNWQPEYHIAYCGTVQEEILASIGELWETADTPFVLAYEQDQLVGLLGLDADLEDKRAELWGPFVRHEKWQYVADQLWQKLYQTYADRLETYSVFYNKRNTLVIQTLFPTRITPLRTSYNAVMYSVRYWSTGRENNLPVMCMLKQALLLRRRASSFLPLSRSLEGAELEKSCCESRRPGCSAFPNWMKSLCV